jgi:hypothetical protein
MRLHLIGEKSLFNDTDIELKKAYAFLNSI